MSEQKKTPQTEKVKGEQDTHAKTDKENRSVDDTEMEEVSGGTRSYPDNYVPGPGDLQIGNVKNQT